MTVAAQPWTLERICEALGNPTLSARCISEINKAKIYEITGVFAKWQGIAEQVLHAAERGRELQAAELAGESIPGEWIDITDEVVERAAQLRARNAA